jgi:hypothetical protein
MLLAKKKEDQLRKEPNRDYQNYYTCLPDTVDPRGPKGK